MNAKKFLALGATLLTLAMLVIACATPAGVPPPAAATAVPAAGQPTAMPAEPTAAATAAAAATEVPTPAPTVERTAKGGDIRVSKSGYQGNLNLWVLGYTPGNAFANPFDNAVEQFEKDNPGITVEITGYPPNDEGFTKLSTALQSGQGIDLLRMPSDRLPGFVAEDLIEPIDDYLTDADKADILPNVLDVTRVTGDNAYAWPLWVVPMGMYLNKDVFEEAGVAMPPKDWTWEQFVEAAKATTFKRANGEQVYGWTGYVDPGVINTWALWMNQDPSVRPIKEDGTYGFNSPETIAGLQRMADLVNVDKVTPPDFGSMKDTDVKGGFANKQFAMITDATGAAPGFKGQNVNFEIYPIPTFNSNKLTVGAVGLIGVAKQADEVKRMAAMDLGRYLTSSEVQEDVPPGSNVPTGFYLAPGARKSVEIVAPLDAFLPVLPDMWVTPLVVDWAKFTRLIHPEYQNILFGKTTPADAMSRIQAEAETYLGTSGQ